jgi:DNA-binding SARP family transcriptional activator/tetratricopeptide (TPR) repeat protein
VAFRTAAIVRYAILGSTGLFDGERVLPPGGPRQVALLALLLVHANRAVPSDQLIDALWGQQRPAGALNSLHVMIWRLRKRLDIEAADGQPVLRTVAGGYLLAVRPGELDAEVFQTRMQEGRRALEAGDARLAQATLAEALGLWRGPVLAEVAYEDWAQSEIRRLEELRLAAVEAWVDAGLRLGGSGAVIAELESLVAKHPGRERLAGQLMLALYRCGRQGEALEVYARARAYLSREMGLEPGPVLKELQADILAQSPALQQIAEELGSAAGDRLPAQQAEVAVGPVRLTLPRPLQIPADSPFVGRDAELARLRERWTQACRGTRSAVLIGGEPGIGKTRLSGELAQVVHEQAGLVLYGRCDEGLAVPYQPFMEALRPYARAVGLDRLRCELGHLTPELGRLLPELAGLGEPVRGDPESERFALFEAVAALVEAMTREQCVLLVLEDLHWASNPTLLLLGHLIRSERPLGALVLCTYRETELDSDQPLAQLLGHLHRDASAERLSISGLDDRAITALVQAAVGHAQDDHRELVRLLTAHTAGNPFFLRELLAHLAESHHALGAGVTAGHLEVPEGLRQVIGQRVARLSAPTGRALRAAAVTGPTFSFVLLERVLNEPAGVLDALDEAVGAGLLTEAGHGDYAFAHALVRQTIYGQLGAARRLRLHRQIGEALQALSDDEQHAEALAYHFAQAAADGQGVKAATYALVAGRSAIARLGYEEAADQYERGLKALSLGGQADERRRCELLLALGEARWGTDELDKARQAYNQAAELAEDLGDATALAHAALGFCGPHRSEVAAAVTDPITDVLQRALTAIGDEDSALRAQLMGRVAAYTGWEHRQPMLAREALEMARRVGDKVTLCDVLASAHWAIRGPDTLLESLAMANELGPLADELADYRLRARAHLRVLDFLLELGDSEAIPRELEALQQLADRQERNVKWMVTVVRAGHAFLEGRLQNCETLAHDALAYRYEGHDEAAAHIFGAQTFFIRSEQGRLDELVETLEFLAAQYPQQRGWRCAVALAYAQLKRRAPARRTLEALAAEGFCDLPRDWNWLLNVSMLSEVAVFLDDAPRAQLLYGLLSPFADRCVVVFALLGSGSVSRSLGLLATTLSRFEDAERHFEQALEMSTQIRSPLWIAHTQHDYAHMLLLRDHRGDHDKALQLLHHALTAAESLGLAALADKTRQLKLTAEAAGPASTAFRTP